jgi:hypothetical protein
VTYACLWGDGGEVAVDGGEASIVTSFAADSVIRTIIKSEVLFQYSMCCYHFLLQGVFLWGVRE